MAKSKSNLTGYGIMIEPLSDADGGGWLATVIRPRPPLPMPNPRLSNATRRQRRLAATSPAPDHSAGGGNACRAHCTRN